MDSVNIIKKIKRTILIVDDEIINQEILKEILGNDYEILTADNGIEALHVVHTSLKPISLILLDINMPLMGGIAFLEAIKKEENYKKIPIIVLTSEKQSELESLELGAADFIKKPYDMPEIIIARVNRSIELSEDRMIIRASERDDLTGVYNKHIFIEYAQKMDTYNSQTKTDMVVLNIDRFHLFNELHGREEGDNVLRSLSEVLKELVRRHDGIVGRLQSDYFMLYMNHIADYNEVLRYIEQEMRNKFNIMNIRFRLGVYIVNDKNEAIDNRIDRAKLVCDEIRSSNKESFTVFDSEAQRKTLFKEKLAQDLLIGIKERQFEVYYQPKYGIKGDKPKLISAEALIRWNHPELGFISPGLFIPLFEENGTIRLLDRYVWNDAAAQIKKWKDELGKSIPVSVNVSRIDMFDSSIVDTILNIVEKNGIEPKDLHLEITESAYNNETEQIIELISEFRDKGFLIEIDDFGSGYSSLNTLAILPFDVLKLDMKFVKQMEKNEKMFKMVRIVADIARFLEVPLIAEGVETENQCDMLKKLGYDIIQGYYFSKPIPAKEFEKFIIKG